MQGGWMYCISVVWISPKCELHFADFQTTEIHAKNWPACATGKSGELKFWMKWWHVGRQAMPRIPKRRRVSLQTCLILDILWYFLKFFSVIKYWIPADLVICPAFALQGLCRVLELHKRTDVLEPGVKNGKGSEVVEVNTAATTTFVCWMDWVVFFVTFHRHMQSSIATAFSCKIPSFSLTRWFRMQNILHDYHQNISEHNRTVNHPKHHLTSFGQGPDKVKRPLEKSKPSEKGLAEWKPITRNHINSYHIYSTHDAVLCYYRLFFLTLFAIGFIQRKWRPSLIPAPPQTPRVPLVQ